MAVGRLLATLDPVNVIAIGLNYRRHAIEGGKEIPDHPLVFVKLTSSVIGPTDTIVLPDDALSAVPDDLRSGANDRLM